MTVEGSLLRDARVRSAMTQTDLACRAGVTQSVISAYESGRRRPSVETLRTLVRAAGFDLELGLAPIPRDLLALSGPIGARVRQTRDELVEAAAAHGVVNLRVFGSVARGQDRQDSDLDLLVDLPPEMGLVGMARLQDRLQELVGTRVDLVPAGQLKAAARTRIQQESVAL